MWPPIEPMSALMTLKVSFTGRLHSSVRFKRDFYANAGAAY
jgi:hypothetical protein